MFVEFVAFALSQTAPSAPPPSPIRVRVEGRSDTDERFLYSHMLSEIRCGTAGEVQPVELVEPYPSSRPRAFDVEPFTLEFAIDAEGRAHSIKLAGGDAMSPYSRDAMPALRASRFAAGSALSDCAVTYTPTLAPMSEVSLEDLARLGVVPRSRMRSDGWMRLSDGDCVQRQMPDRLLKGYPDFRKVEGREGAREWTYVTFDIDATGEPQNVEATFGSGNEALNQEGVRAVSAGRFTEGPRTGCIVNWWKNPATLAAPDLPDEDEFKGNEACEMDERWEVEPVLSYPYQHRRRAIEGWAIVQYDVAPWGEIGAIEVLEVQPSADFGDAARNVLRRAQFKPSEQGLSGCIDRIIFRMSGEDNEEETEG